MVCSRAVVTSQKRLEKRNDCLDQANPGRVEAMSLSFRRKTRTEEGRFRDLSRIRRRTYLVKIVACETSIDCIRYCTVHSLVLGKALASIQCNYIRGHLIHAETSGPDVRERDGGSKGCFMHRGKHEAFSGPHNASSILRGSPSLSVST